MSADRGSVWRAMGAPTDQEGSVNEPRTRDDYGVQWNEKWIYRGGQGALRIVLWNRYDLVGVFLLQPDGSAVSEPFPPD